MAHSRPFGLFILVLCLVACLCAHGEVSNAEAKKAAEGARESAKKVLNDVKREIKDTVAFQNDIDTYKIDAEAAATEAEKAAQGNSEAEAIAQKAKKASDEALKLYPKASEPTQKYLDRMRGLRTKAKELDDKATNDLYISRWSANNYTKIKEDADAIKSQVEALNTEYNKELSSFSDVYATEKEMLKFVSDAQLARYHVDVIVGVAKIDALLKTADADIKLTEQKREETNATVQEMKKLYDTSPEKLSHHIQRLYSRTEFEFDSASEEVEKAKKEREGMLQQKTQANDTLVKFKAETDVRKAKDEASGVGRLAKNAEKNVEEIKKALRTATISATTAVNLKKSALNELNKQTNKPDTTQENNKTNPQDSSNTHHPVKDTTASPAVIEPKKPTITNPDESTTEQTVKETTKSPAVIEPKKPTITNPDESMTEQTVKETTESPTVIEAKKPTITNPDESTTEQTVKETTESPTVIEAKKPTITNPDESTTEQTVKNTTASPAVIEPKKPTITNPNQKGSEGTEPTRPSSNDSAMAVSVPLLLAMIACAALH